MLNGALLIVVVFSVLQAVGHLTQPARRVAITIDDGPVVGEMTDLAAFQRVSNGLIASLTADKVPATIFVNERQLNVPGQRDARAAVLEQWLDAGFDLANHTYSHPSLNKVPLWQFNELNSVALRDTVARVRKRGYEFITLDEAMTDPAYQRPDTFAGPGGSWLARTATVMGKRLTVSRPAVPEWIGTLGSGPGARTRVEVSAQAPPGLAFREDWKESPAATPVTQAHVAHPDLLLSVHGPGADLVKKSHHDQPADDPFYIWSGDTTAPWAVSLRHRRGVVDLSGLARVRWRAKQSGFHELRLIVQIDEKQWLVADQADGASSDWRERGFAIADLTWRTLDITRIVEGRAVDRPDLSRVLAIGVTDLRAGGGTPASSRLDWIEVYGTVGGRK